MNKTLSVLSKVSGFPRERLERIYSEEDVMKAEAYVQGRAAGYEHWVYAVIDFLAILTGYDPKQLEAVYMECMEEADFDAAFGDFVCVTLEKDW